MLVFMNNNARPHRSRAVTAYLQREAVTSLSLPAMSSDFNPMKHVCDTLGRRVQAVEPHVQNLRHVWDTDLYKFNSLFSDPLN
jgi:transposase